MSYRYRVARAMGQSAFDRAVQEDQELLDEFGLKLLFVDPGVRAAIKSELRENRINPWNVIEIDGKTWKWLRPLLLELREARDAGLVEQRAAAN